MENAMVNIDDLTYGQLKEIVAKLSGSAQPVIGASVSQHPFVGKYVICRCFSAGVHAGELVSQNGDQVVLRNARRLWSWTANDGIALSGLAVHGLKKGNVDTKLDSIAITGVIKTIPCSKASQESINGA